MAPPPPSPHTQTLRLKSHKTTVLLHIDPLQSFTSIKSELLAALRETGLRHADTGATIPLPDSLRAEDVTLGRPRNVNEPKAGFEVAEWEVGRQGAGGEGGEDGGIGNGVGDEDDEFNSGEAGEDEDAGEDDSVQGKGKGKAKRKLPSPTSPSPSTSNPAKRKPGRPSTTTKPPSTSLDPSTAASIAQCPKGVNLKDGAVLAFRFPGDGTGWEDTSADIDQDEDEDEDIDELAPGHADKTPKHMWGVRIASFEDGYGVENEGDVGGVREFEG
ncbi:hypothetical protein K491DRAFT_104409 [Lophiostoma macrostomum CBS 122681]|uniref:Uncharacterized protein n=1 Tax=Lophiostoma macrostomum CBS 122681 TaxID=1314788 RepID=A0A6A6SU86_9PLEO|nr:hypothetical protein K491DRAFT_104409 [Lophiostoma macrostomum CBS 122681]